MRGGRSGGGRSGGGYGRSGGGLSGGGAGRSSRTSGGARSSMPRPAPRPSTPRPAPRPAPRSSSGGSAFGRGVAQGVGFGMGQQMGRNMMGGRRRRGGFGGGRRVVHHHHGGSGGGCFTFIMIAVIILAIIWIAGLLNGSDSGMGLFGGGQQAITASTRVREPLPANAASTTGAWFTDNPGWIGNTTQMNAGLINFHRLTGVRPHVYLLNNLNGSYALPTTQELGVFASQRYNELFDDAAHLLFVFFVDDDGEYSMYVEPGNQARSVIDGEATDIIMDYVQRNFYNDNLTDEQVFSNSFNSAAERIMYVPYNPWPTVIMVVVGVIAAIVILIILKSWWKKKKAQENLEAEQTERILNTPLQGFENTSSPADDLAKKYEEEQ